MAPRAPFDDADADIIFRSSDMIEFHLYKVIVAKASLVMQGMLTLPDQSPAERPQVVDLSEDADTLESLFRLCYPVDKPKFTSVDQLQIVLAAALKYEMMAVAAGLGPTIKQFVQTDPLRVYAISYQVTGMEDVTREAARILLRFPKLLLPPNIYIMPEFHTLPSVAAFALFAYRQDCIDAALRVWEERDWVLREEPLRLWPSAQPEDDRWVWFSEFTGHTKASDFGAGFNAPDSQWSRKPCSWWWDYYRSLKDILAKRPTGDTLRSLMASSKGREGVTAKSCATCRIRACTDLLSFNDLLAEKIDAAVSKVHLKLPSDWIASAKSS